VADDAALREELNTAVAARRELGEELEPAVIDAFVERIEQRIDKRLDAHEAALKRKRDHQKEMILGSMGVSVPLFVIAAIFAGLPGIVAVCLTLAVIAIVSSRD
jgi:VIT1/CCC1 family predicted Fe2+/Mn2+ transporter